MTDVMIDFVAEPREIILSVFSAEIIIAGLETINLKRAIGCLLAIVYGPLNRGPTNLTMKGRET